MNQDVKAVSLQEEHIDGIVTLMNKNGWYYYDRCEIERYLALKELCLILLKDEQVIGSIFTTSFDNQVWIGNIIVEKEFRGQGFAGKLIKCVIDQLLKENKDFTFRLGSVPLAIGVYKKIGFHAEAFTTAQEAELPINIEKEDINLGENKKIEFIKEQDLKEISKIDQEYFKSERLKLFTNLYHDSIKESCLCLKDQGRIVGYIMIRRRKDSKQDANFTDGPDYVYRLGPSCVLPEYGINGFKVLFAQAIQSVNKEVKSLKGISKIYVVFPRNAKREEIYADTKELAIALGLDKNLNQDIVFDEHDHIFGAKFSTKNEEQWKYMESLGFHQEYFEQVMSYTPSEESFQKRAAQTQANPIAIFATATPGDKA